LIAGLSIGGVAVCAIGVAASPSGGPYQVRRREGSSFAADLIRSALRLEDVGARHRQALGQLVLQVRRVLPVVRSAEVGIESIVDVGVSSLREKRAPGAATWPQEKTATPGRYTGAGGQVMRRTTDWAADVAAMNLHNRTAIGG
jgi:hypothetical protein